MGFPSSEMTETISVRSKFGSGAYGPVFGESVSMACRGEPGYRRVTNAQGAEVVASLMLFCPAGSNINPEDEVTYNSRVYEVVDAQPMSELGGIASHVEVTLTSVSSAVEGS